MAKEWEIICGDALEILKTLDAESVQCVVTSPPYWGLRDYGVDGQLGLEKSPEEYIGKLVEIFREVKRVLRNDGVFWLNLADSYNNTSGYSRASPEYYREGRKGGSADKKAIKHSIIKIKDLCGIPWRVAFALQADGWYLRRDIIWAKNNPMPESTTDRCTSSHEYIFHLTKSAKYFYDNEAVKEPAQDWGKRGRKAGSAFVDGTPGRAKQSGGKNCDFAASGRNKRSVWQINTRPFSEAHFATFPPELPEVCIKAGTAPGDMVLDPFSGAGTTGLVANRLGRSFIGIEINPEYCELSRKRIFNDAPLFNQGGG